jgi:PAS domain S-box-containing protein
LTGVTSDKACGKPLEEVVRLVSDKTDETTVDVLERAFASGELQTLTDHTKLITTDNRELPVDCTATPIRDTRGEMIGAVLVFRDVTARRESERSLLESRELLSATLESITDAFMALGSDWRFTYVNAAAEKALGRSRNDLIGRNHWEVYPDMVETELKERYERVLRERQSTAFDFYSKRSDRWLEVNAYPSQDGGIAIYFRDVTLRKAIDAALAQSRAETERARDLLQTTLASIGDGVIATDIENRVTFLNTVAAASIGIPIEEAIGKPIEDVFVIVNESTRLPVDNPAARAIHDGVIVGLANHTILLAKDGRETPIDDSAAPIRNADQSIIGAVLVFRDVTDRRAAEKALVESEERLRLALRVGEIGVWDWDIRTNRIAWSERVYAMHGVQPGDFSGRIEDLLPLIHPDDQDRVQCAIQAAVSESAPYQVQLRAVHPDGTIRWLETTGQVIRDEHGQPVRMLGATTDITDRVIAEAEMQRQAKDLERSNADLERFAFAASHDLQEPLRMITLYSQLLSRSCKAKFDEEDAKNVEIILDGTNRMRTLIQDLLAYSQVTNAQHAPVPVDTEGVFKQVLRNCEPAVKESGAVIEFTSLPVVQARESQLAQVFQNLLVNAIRYRSDVPPRIEVSATRSGREWLFAVRDNGVGSPPQQHARVFELFKRLDSKSPGTGIGLALCERIIDGHGGRIWVDSAPGKGSTFFFTLPFAADGPPQAPPRRAGLPSNE